jgi:hypothetical protein
MQNCIASLLAHICARCRGARPRNRDRGSRGCCRRAPPRQARMGWPAPPLPPPRRASCEDHSPFLFLPRDVQPAARASSSSADLRLFFPHGAQPAAGAPSSPADPATLLARSQAFLLSGRSRALLLSPVRLSSSSGARTTTRSRVLWAAGAALRDPSAFPLRSSYLFASPAAAPHLDPSAAELDLVAEQLECSGGA